jgi:hypothetical protein
MADATTYVAKYTAANAPLNEKGDLSGWAILMTEDCTFGEFGTNRAEIIKALQQNLDQGWVAHHPIAAAAAGEFLVGVYSNVAKDGSAVIGSGVLRFNPDGQLIEITSLEPVEGQPPVEVDSALLIGRWSQAVDAFNRGDMAGFSTILGEQVSGDSSDLADRHVVVTHTSDTKADFMGFLQAGRDQGWQTHHVLGVAAAGEFLAAVAENRYADGRRIVGSYIFGFSPEGLIVRAHGLNPAT